MIHGALPAAACSCMAPNAYNGLVESDGAFVGTLIQVDRDPASLMDSGTLIDLRFDVEVAVKGEIGDAILVKSAADGAACGIEVPIGERAGILLERIGGEWHGNLCWTVDADTLIAAAAGPPAPLTGSPPHLIVALSMGEAGLVALDRQGRIVGYGAGPQPYLLGACPDHETFVGLVDQHTVRVWSFRDLRVLQDHFIETGDSTWVRNLTCNEAGGDGFYAVLTDQSETTESSSLFRHSEGVAEVVADDIEAISVTGVGLVAIGSDGAVYVVEPETGALETVVDSVGDVRNQIAYLQPSPDGMHVALSAVDWSGARPMGRVIVVDLAVGTWVDRIFDCDLYPIWVDDERLSLFDSCVSEQPDLYTRNLEPIGPGDDPGPAYGSRAVDETGAVFYPSSYAVGVVEPGAPEGVDLARLPTYPGEILVVPQEMRSRWVGSEFVPSPPGELDPVIDIATDGLLDVSLPDVASDAGDGFDSPPWLMVLGSLLIAGALSVILVVGGGSDRSG